MYQKEYNEGEAVKGLLVVSEVSYPGVVATMQVKHELGKTYRRSFNPDEMVWDEWTTFSVYEEAISNGLYRYQKRHFMNLCH